MAESSESASSTKKKKGKKLGTPQKVAYGVGGVLVLDEKV